MRPLTHMSDAADGEHPLTPTHFLCPGVFCVSGDEILPPTPPDGVSLNYTWKQSRALIDGFWKRWSRDYVAALQARPKWRATEADLKVGEVVLLVDEQIRRGDWKLGRIVSVSGDGDHVRKASVRTANGKTFERDRGKLVRLELDPVRVV